MPGSARAAGAGGGEVPEGAGMQVPCRAMGLCEEPVLQGAGALGALGSVLGLGPPLCPVQPIAGPALPGTTAARCQLCLCAPPASPVLLSLFMA